MSSTTEIELLNFFIFNPTFACSEGEEEKKILYFYPAQVDKDSQLKNAGLCEALIKFTSSFNPSSPCSCFHTEKTKQFLYQPEENFWFVLTVNVPCLTKTTEVMWTNEYQSEKVQENVYSAVLQQTYRMFRLFNGTLKSVLGSSFSEDKIQFLKDKLQHFYSRYLLNLRLGHCDLLDVFQGIYFLPLGKEPFLHVQSFINLVESIFQPVRYSAFLYNDQLVWSGIEPDDMQIIYQYLVHTLLPSHLDLELQGGSLPRGNNSTVHHYGSFVTGPPNLKDSIVSTGKVPKVFLQSDSKPEVYHLVVYRALSATLCLFIDQNDTLSLELFKNLDSHLGPHLTTLVSEIAEYCARQAAVMQTANDAGPKYLYFNKLNLAQKSTVHLDSRKNGNISVPQDILRVISEVNSDKSGTHESGEVVMKTLNDCWIVGKLSNSREFYVIVTQKKASLIEIDDEVKKLCENQLKGIFFAV